MPIPLYSDMEYMGVDITMRKRKVKSGGENLAIFLHNEYEKQAKIVGWKTQDSCQVEFDKLPETNKKVMLAVAQAILDVGFVKFKNTDLMSVKIEEDKIIITIKPSPREF